MKIFILRTLFLVPLLFLGIACADQGTPAPTLSEATQGDSFERLYNEIRAEMTLTPVPPDARVDDLLLRIRQLERELYSLSREVDTLTQRHYIEDMR